MPKTRAVAALVVAVLLVVTGCSSAGDDASAVRTVQVTMTDNAFQPARFEVGAGETVTFEFVNEGRQVHEAFFGDESAQMDHSTEAMGGDAGHSMDMDDESVVTVDPGRSGELTYTFDQPGTVLIGCHQPGHWESGMKATVTVR
jgi:uncharacterized cupredoxin-like copper-binding protein